MTLSSVLSKEQISLVKLVQEKAPGKAYLVGGVVRDIFLGEKLQDKDLDFIIEGSAFKVANECSKKLGGQVREFCDFLTAKIIAPEHAGNIKEIDFASSRAETYSAPGSLPDVISAPISEDLKRRDFSINAVALPLDSLVSCLEESDFDVAILREQAIDYFHGLDDLNRRLIRVLHERSFIDDPTRIFRACRYAARIGGSIEPDTKELIEEALKGHAFNTISATRKLNEIKKMMLEVRWLEGMRLLEEFSVLSAVGLCREDRKQELMGYFEKAYKESLHEFKNAEEKDALFHVILSLLFYCMPESEAEDIFRKFGFGRKTFGRIERNLKQASTSEKQDFCQEADALGGMEGHLLWKILR